VRFKAPFSLLFTTDTLFRKRFRRQEFLHAGSPRLAGMLSLHAPSNSAMDSPSKVAVIYNFPQAGWYHEQKVDTFNL